MRYGALTRICGSSRARARLSPHPARAALAGGFRRGARRHLCARSEELAAGTGSRAAVQVVRRGGGDVFQDRSHPNPRRAGNRAPTATDGPAGTPRQERPAAYPHLVRFEGRFRAGIQDGTVTVTFRRWKRPQAVAGHRYRTTAGMDNPRFSCGQSATLAWTWLGQVLRTRRRRLRR